MRLVVGLGNPGARYRDTPHNAGFRVCDRFAERHGFAPEEHRFDALFRRARVRGLDIGLLKPQTFMNRSGDSVAEALRYLPVQPEDLVVVFDEIDLPLGKLRIRPKGGAGGHNGVRSLIAGLGSFADFPRVRLGVGRPTERRDPTGHLLSRVSSESRERFEALVERGTDALEAILFDGLEAAMNRWNGLAAVGEETDPS